MAAVLEAGAVSRLGIDLMQWELPEAEGVALPTGRAV